MENSDQKLKSAADQVKMSCDIVLGHLHSLGADRDVIEHALVIHDFVKGINAHILELDLLVKLLLEGEEEEQESYEQNKSEEKKNENENK